MKFEYQTTVMHISENLRGKTIPLIPPGESWSLLGVSFNGEYALYTWAKQSVPQTLAKFESSDKDFEVSCKMVAEMKQQIDATTLESNHENSQNLSDSTSQK